MRAYEKSNRFILRNKGELAPDRSEKAENMSTQFQRLLNNTLQFAEVLDEEMPNLPEEGKLALNIKKRFFRPLFCCIKVEITIQNLKYKKKNLR